MVVVERELVVVQEVVTVLVEELAKAPEVVQAEEVAVLLVEGLVKGLEVVQVEELVEVRGVVVQEELVAA